VPFSRQHASYLIDQFTGRHVMAQLTQKLVCDLNI
jgi:hypothetical protein